MANHSKLSKTEIKVLRSIANGTREFDKSTECRAIWKLVKRGHIEAEFKEQTVGRFKHYNWGKHWKWVREPAGYVRVSTPKIDTAIAKHGLATFLQALAQEEAK